MSMTAKTIRALELKLPSGSVCVFVQHGDPWNFLQEWRCVAPATLIDERIVTAPHKAFRSMTRIFFEVIGEILRDTGEHLSVVMASEKMTSELRPAPPTTCAESVK
jgi:hypothetical protein